MLPSSLLQYLAQSLSASFTSAARPALTFFVVQISVLIGAKMEWLSTSPNITWMLHPIVIAGALILTILESMAQHDEDISMMMHDLKIHPIIAACGTYASVLLFSSLGLPTEEAAQMLQSEAMKSNIVHTTKDIVLPYAKGENAGNLHLGVAASAVVSNLSITYLRGYIHEYLDDLDLLPIWQKIETGGVIGALLILILAPVLCLVLFLGVLIMGSIIGFSIRKINQQKDQMERYPCPQCGDSIRLEALICKSCHTTLVPKKNLHNKTKIGLREALFPQKTIEHSSS